MCYQHNKDIEKQYDLISNEFDNTRNRIWGSVQTFLRINQDDKSQKRLLDIGIGNGKNTIFAQNHNYSCVGTDISSNLIDICKKKGIIEVYKKDIMNLQICDYGEFDCILCIAVIHHLRTIDEQKIAIKNMINCLHKNGKILISVWSYEIYDNTEKKYKDYRNFQIGANLVKWKSNNIDIQINRFYFIHNFYTFNKMFEDIQKDITFNYSILWEKQNWFCEISL